MPRSAERMGQDTRVTYKRRHAYATRSNRRKIIKTPGGKLTLKYVKKSSHGPRCGDCKNALAGIKHMKPKEYKLVHKRERTVSRAYGGSRCGKCVKERIVRAFLIEEQKIVKKVLAEKGKKTKAATTASK